MEPETQLLVCRAPLGPLCSFMSPSGGRRGFLFKLSVVQVGLGVSGPGTRRPLPSRSTETCVEVKVAGSVCVSEASESDRLSDAVNRK